MIKRNLLTVLFLATWMIVLSQSTSGVRPVSFESIHIQTDRDIYVPGETIRIKIDYLINYKRRETDVSQVAYVELLHLNGDIISKSKLGIKNGLATSYIQITEGLSSGYYILRAYTQYQRNFSSTQFATKFITLINPNLPLTGYKMEEDTLIEVALIKSDPENHQKTKMALKLDGRISPKVKSVYVVNQYTDTISRVKLAKNGLGCFSFSTIDSLTYSLSAKLMDGTTLIENIPDLWNKKPVLNAEFRNGTLYCKLKPLSNETDVKKENYRLEIYNKKFKLISDHQLSSDNSWNEIQWSTDNAGNSFVFLLLKNENAVIEAIQAISLPEPNRVEIRVSTNKTIYSTREKIELELFNETKSKNIDYFSVSVAKRGTNYQTNNVSAFVVENPQLLPDYLTFQSDISVSHWQVEALLGLYSEQLLSRQENWPASIYAKTTLDWLPEIRGITIGGIVQEKESGKPVVGVDVYIATIGDHPQLHIFTTDQDGRFISTLNHPEKLNNVFLCIRDENEKNLEILVNSDFDGLKTTFNYTPLLLDTSDSRFIKSLYVNAQVSRQSDLGDTKSTTAGDLKPVGFTEPEIKILLDDYIDMPNLQDVFNELVPYVKVRKSKSDFILEVFDDRAQVTYSEPLILLDNLPVFDINELIKINPKVVVEISVINHTIVYGDHIIRGIILVKSNTDNFADIKLPLSSTFLEFSGTTSDIEFIYPEYQSNEQLRSKMPDFRNTLYWNPNVKLNGGKYSTTFSASDHKSLYDIIIHGVTTDGTRVYGRSEFEVRD